MIELMITVALIGILAAIAIPNFMAYQARSRRSEAYANLNAIARSETSYFAEKDEYFGTGLPFPDFTAQNNGVLSAQKMKWDGASQTAYGALGWRPEGEVFYSYEINIDTACTCDTCFTASAFGDVDADGLVSAVMFVKPEREGAITECPSILHSFGTPTRLSTGQPVYDEVAVNRETDEY